MISRKFLLNEMTYSLLTFQPLTHIPLSIPTPHMMHTKQSQTLVNCQLQLYISRFFLYRRDWVRRWLVNSLARSSRYEENTTNFVELWLKQSNRNFKFSNIDYIFGKIVYGSKSGLDPILRYLCGAYLLLFPFEFSNIWGKRIIATISPGRQIYFSPGYFWHPAFLPPLTLQLQLMLSLTLIL